MPRCVGDEISICVTSLPFCKAGVGICADGSTNLKAFQRLFVLQSPRPAGKNQLRTPAVCMGLTCPTLPLPALLMAPAACLCANVEITGSSRRVLMRTLSYVHAGQRRTSADSSCAVCTRQAKRSSNLPMSSPAIGRFINNPRQGPLSPPAHGGPSHRPSKSHSGLYHRHLRQLLI